MSEYRAFSLGIWGILWGSEVGNEGDATFWRLSQWKRRVLNIKGMLNKEMKYTKPLQNLKENLHI